MAADTPAGIARLVAAARSVAADPSDAALAQLLDAAFDCPFDEMPRAFLDAPAPGPFWPTIRVRPAPGSSRVVVATPDPLGNRTTIELAAP